MSASIERSRRTWPTVGMSATRGITDTTVVELDGAVAVIEVTWTSSAEARDAVDLAYNDIKKTVSRPVEEQRSGGDEAEWESGIPHA